MAVREYTPWNGRLASDTPTGHDGSAWRVGVLPLVGIADTESDVALALGNGVTEVLHEVGRTSKAGLRKKRKHAIEDYREVQLVAVDVPSTILVPPGTPQMLARQQRPWLGGIESPLRVAAIATKLRRNRLLSGGTDGLAKFVATGGLTLDVLSQDRARIGSAYSRANAVAPGEREWQALTAWYNRGRWADVEIRYHYDHIHVFQDSGGFQTLEYLHESGGVRTMSDCRDWPNDIPGHFVFAIASVYAFGDEESAEMFDSMGTVELSVLHPSVGWVPAAFDQGAVAVSIRFRLEPGQVVKKTLETNMRQAEIDIAKSEAKGKFNATEAVEQREMMGRVRDRYSTGKRPMACTVSGLAAFAIPFPWWEPPDWRELSAEVGVALKPMTEAQRQKVAFHEMQLTANDYSAPIRPDLDIERLGFAGFSACSQGVERKGVFLGASTADRQSIWMDPDWTIDEDNGPVWSIVGNTGAGKTILMESIALQAVLAGRRVFYVNLKPGDNLSPAARLAQQLGAPARYANLDDVRTIDGLWDPFHSRRQSSPEDATSIIFRVNPWGMREHIPPEAENRIGYWLRRGYEAGARCTGEALKMALAENPQANEPYIGPILRLAEHNMTFRAMCGLDPTTVPWSSQEGLTLIELGGALADLPPAGSDPALHSQAQRIAATFIWAMLHGASHSLEGKRSLLMIDEAWAAYLTGMESLDQLARVWRSHKIVTILGNQRFSQQVPLLGYSSRLTVGYLDDRDEGRLALQALEREPSPEALRAMDGWKSIIDSNRRVIRGSLWLHKDPAKRLVEMEAMINPVWVAQLSTNAIDKERREAAANAAPAAGRFSVETDPFA